MGYMNSTVYLSSSKSPKICVVSVSLIKDETSLSSPKHSPWYICLMWTESLKGKSSHLGWGGVISLCLFLSDSCWCQAQCSAPVPSPPLLSAFLPWVWCTDVYFFPERLHPPDLRPKKSHSPAPSSFVHCLCLHGSFSPFPAIWFYPSSSVDEISPLPHLSVIATHLLLAPVGRD